MTAKRACGNQLTDELYVEQAHVCSLEANFKLVYTSWRLKEGYDNWRLTGVKQKVRLTRGYASWSLTEC